MTDAKPAPTRCPTCGSPRRESRVMPWCTWEDLKFPHHDPWHDPPTRKADDARLRAEVERRMAAAFDAVGWTPGDWWMIRSYAVSVAVSLVLAEREKYEKECAGTMSKLRRIADLERQVRERDKADVAQYGALCDRSRAILARAESAERALAETRGKWGHSQGCMCHATPEELGVPAWRCLGDSSVHLGRHEHPYRDPRCSPAPAESAHVCGLQGFGAQGDICPVCQAESADEVKA